MKFVVWLIVAILIVLGGVFAFRTTDDADLGQEELMEVDQDGGNDGDGQFLQVMPANEPGGEEVETLVETLSADDSVETTSEVTVISMSETGFSPSEVTIAVGGTVNFVNDGQAKHWPASAVHPTHEALPGFDAKAGVPTGGEYSYTFDEAGSWKFHDHLQSSFTGTITVK